MWWRGCWSSKIKQILNSDHIGIARFEDGVEVVRLRKSWIGEEMLSEASLDDDELDLTVLLKQQGLTLILSVFAKDFDDSDEVLDLVISKV